MNCNIVYSVDDPLGTGINPGSLLGSHNCQWKELNPNIAFHFFHSFLLFFLTFSIFVFSIHTSCHASFFFFFLFSLKQQKLLSTHHHFLSFPSHSTVSLSAPYLPSQDTSFLQRCFAATHTFSTSILMDSWESFMFPQNSCFKKFAVLRMVQQLLSCSMKKDNIPLDEFSV